MRGAWYAAASAAVLTIALTAVVVNGYGIRPSGVVGGAMPTASARTEQITLFLFKKGRLVAVKRPGMPDRPYLAVSQLGVPLTEDERAEGLSTRVPRMNLWAQEPINELPPGTAGSPGGGGIAMLFMDIIPGREVRLPREALAQIACTAEAIPGQRGIPRLGSAPETQKLRWRELRCDDYRDLR
ncbi:hypothetical protein SMC26_41935 [Actinomadura fulvescens]|uniref:Uncharacterized protein n=1 Tax=Actinomadura fulvescens TaxID=46160 RepID=A0ABP6BM97_9ACTN